MRAIPTFLMLFLALESSGFLFEFLLHHPSSPAKALWLGLLMTSSFLVAPCIYLLAREITEGQRPQLRSLPSGHFFIVAAGLILTLPLLRTVHLGELFPDPSRQVNEAESLFIHTTMVLCISVFCLQVPFYLKKCWFILNHHKTNKSPSNRNIEQSLIIKMLMIIVLTNWLTNMCRTLDCMFFKDGPLVYSLIEVSVTLVVLLLVLRRGLFASPASYAPPKLDIQKRDVKYANSALTPQLRTRILTKVEDALASKCCFKNNTLTLQDLSTLIGEKPHYVSQVINQDLQSNFFELINRHRINEAQRLLLHCPDKTILHCAMEVGFNSKSTFNLAFKKFTGMTPKEFKLQQTIDSHTTLA